MQTQVYPYFLSYFSAEVKTENWANHFLFDESYLKTTK